MDPDPVSWPDLVSWPSHCVSAAACSPRGAGACEPGQGKAVFRVTEGPGTVVKQNSRLHVQRDGRTEAVLIDDDAIFSTVAFVRYEHWLLVVCRGPDEVWAGYDYDAAKLYGEGDWSMLPFTRWSGQGDVVAERRLREESASPANFPPQTGGPGYQD